MTYPFTAPTVDSDQFSPAELVASVQQMTEHLSRDCAGAGLGFLAHLLAMAALEARDILDGADTNLSPAAEANISVGRHG